MSRLAIVGSGDLGQLLAHHAVTDGKHELMGFLDDFRRPGEVVGLGAILGTVEQTAALHEANGFDALLVGVGYKHFSYRRSVFERFRERIPFATLIHSSAFVDPTAHVESGAVVLPGCVLDRNVVISENALLNTGCVVAHDSVIGAHSFVGPGVRVAGYVRTGPCVFLGIGTIVIDNLSIAEGCRTGGGTVVVKDLATPGLYVGTPARLLRGDVGD